MKEGIYVNPWLIHVYVWQKTNTHCKAVILQFKKKKNNFMLGLAWHPVVKNSPANAGYTGLIHGLGTMILHTSEQLSLCSRAHALQRESHLNEKPAHRS